MAHILIVEDEENIARMIEATLALGGHTSQWCPEGTQALPMIETGDFGLVLLDVMLPGLDGFAIMERLKSQEVPVIFLSAMQQVEDKVRGLRLGAEDYISKPFEPLELLARIEVVLRRRLRQGAIQLGTEEMEQTARQVLSRQAMDGYLAGLVLLDGNGGVPYAGMGEELIDQIPAPPAEEPDAAVYQLCPGGDGETWFLVCAMPVTLESSPYRLCAAYNVSGLQRQLEREAANAVVLCLGLSLTGAGLLLALVWLLLRPLAALDESARRVADGRCGERLAAWVTLGYAAPQRSEFFWLLEDGTAYYPYRHRRVSAAATSAGTPKRRIPASMAR